MRRFALCGMLIAAVSGIGGRGAAADWVGYVGCSQTQNAVWGYHLIGGKRFWPVIGSYGGGSVAFWANGIGKSTDKRWTDFKLYLAKMPPSQIWVQWCTRDNESQAENETAAPRVLNEIRRLAPGVPIYISAQNGYWLPHACPISGLLGPLRMQLLTVTSRSGLALPGPDIGDLHSKYQTPSIPPLDETDSDGCHANKTGATKVLGPSLKQFFG